jgi:hypothetical protein
MALAGAETGRPRMPMARMRRMKAAPYAEWWKGPLRDFEFADRERRYHRGGRIVADRFEHVGLSKMFSEILFL